jgi:NAD(P)-dependent dehydrogenase (short-subunit alcohol dehydrogenase family)
MKTLMVTGAGAGIGAAIAAASAAAGYRVLVCDIDGERARSVAARLPSAVAFQLDVSRETDVERVLDALDVVPDALVNNAGIVRFGPLLELSVEHFRSVIEVNLLGVFICSRAVARRMATRRSGVIVSMSSINATHPGPGAGAYPATKAAVVSLTQQMSLEWAGSGLRVNAVAPGFIDAGMSAPIYANPRVRESRGSAVPLQRLGTAEEVAAAVLFLCSDQAAYINGHELVVDGGVVNSVLSRLPRE